MYLAKTFLLTATLAGAMLASPPAAAEPNRIPEPPPFARPCTAAQVAVLPTARDSRGAVLPAAAQCPVAPRALRPVVDRRGCRAHEPQRWQAFLRWQIFPAAP
jgi:hypothetical protein